LKVNLARAAWKAGDRKTARDRLTEARTVLPEWREYTLDFPAELVPK
jgi:hypothetical protein